MSKWTIAIVATVALSVCAGSAQAALVNGGFETNESLGGVWPGTYGDWSGDLSQRVGTTNGIAPQQGSWMLEFLGTSAGGANGATREAEVGQLVDITPQQADGTYTANLSGWFNRVNGNAQTDTEFAVAVYAMSGNPGGAHANYLAGNYLSSNAGNVLTTGNTWQQAATSMLIPEGTDYLMVVAKAREDVSNDATFREFDGHYGDNIQLNITGGVGDDDDDDDDTGPRARLTYNRANGEVTIETLSGDAITHFVLLSPEAFLAGNVNWPDDNLGNVAYDSAIVYTDPELIGFDGIVSIGQILEAMNITEQELIDNYLTTAKFSTATSGGLVDFDIRVEGIIPEPITMSLLATGGLAVLIRRRRK
jgi:hypothetical protein